MSAATDPAPCSAVSAAGGTGAGISEPLSLAGLKQRAEDVYEKLREAASLAASSRESDDELALWDCVRQSILDDKGGRLAFRQFLKQELKYSSSKDEVLRQTSTLERLVATLAAGEAEGDDIEEERAELAKLETTKDNALDELRPLRLSLIKSILASVVCRLGSESHPSAFFQEQVESARLLAEGSDALKHMQGAIKEATALCFQAHGVAADKQATLENELAKLAEDAELQLLRPAAKWPTAWCLNEFKPSAKPKLPRPDKGAKAPVPAPAPPTADSAPSAAATLSLADVTARVELKPAESKATHTELNVPVKITCDKLCAGHLIRMKAVDCVVGGVVAYFVKHDGKKPTKLQEAKQNERVTLVLKVVHQPGLLVSETPHTDMRITSFDDNEHSRW